MPHSWIIGTMIHKSLGQFKKCGNVKYQKEVTFAACEERISDKRLSM